jgi:hypothetical protein
MERFPRGSLPPYAFNAVATRAPVAVAREGSQPVEQIAATACDLTKTCPTCLVEMLPEHAHYKCPQCGYRDSCCF